MDKNKWIKKIKESLFNHDKSPEAKAFSVALGVFIAFSPFMGFHILMAIASCALFSKLDKPLVVGFTLTNNWWTMIPIYGTGLWIGETLLKSQHFDITTVKWEMFRLRHILNGETFSYITSYLKPMVLPFFIGSMVFAIVATIVSYYISLFILKKNITKHQKPSIVSE